MQDPVTTDDDGRRPAAVVVGNSGSRSSPGKTDRDRIGDKGPTRHRRAPVWLTVAGSVAVGAIAAVLGTALHGQLWEVGGTNLPIGALAAITLVGSAAVFTSLSVRSVYMSPVVGGVAYLVVGAFAAAEGQPLVLTDLGMDPVLPSALAGSIWMFGLAGVTVIATVVSWWVLRPRRTANLRAV